MRQQRTEVNASEALGLFGPAELPFSTHNPAAARVHGYPITSMEVVEAVAEADAAAAWNLMIGATYGIWAAFLPEVSARDIYGATDAVDCRRRLTP